MPNGALALDKPSGMTSAGAVARVKRLLPKKTKIGHTGTLDPLASGLLILLIGRATRLSRYLMGQDKSYIATARFGATSDTLDADGEITPLNLPMPTEETIRAALPSLTGDLLQTPPMASALKIGGERLYNLHRRGITVERESRPVKVSNFDLVFLDPGQECATFEIRCSSGTYVRSLISDLATSLGTGAYLTALRRTSVGNIQSNSANYLEELSPDTIVNHIIQPSRVIGGLPVFEVGSEEVAGICNGRKLRSCGIEGSFRVESEGELLAVYRGDGVGGRAEVVLCGP